MYTASGSLRLHLKSHLSRLSANVFGGLNGLGGGGGGAEAAAAGGMNGLNMFRGLEAMFGEKNGEGGGNAEMKFNIKQEMEEQREEAPRLLGT